MPDANAVTFWRRMIWIAAAGIVIPPLIGLAVTVVRVMGALDTMGLEGGSDPGSLATNVSFTLLTTIGGLATSLLALPVFITAIVLLFKSRRRLETRTRAESSAAERLAPHPRRNDPRVSHLAAAWRSR
jgi:hypothetical protein